VTELSAVVEQVTASRPKAFESVAAALETLLEGAGDGLVVTGSLTTAGEALRVLRDGS
jgi:folylpolyglutamate synthase/dihydropteroate synthase